MGDGGGVGGGGDGGGVGGGAIERYEEEKKIGVGDLMVRISCVCFGGGGGGG